jgi:cell growth-regulating nucleolar protein
VTEHEKYALGATKPGGKAKAAEQAAAPEAAAASAPEDDGQPVGEEHLSSQPPWKCK